MPLWELSVSQHGKRNKIRYRLPSWLANGKLVAIADEDLQAEQLFVFDPESTNDSTQSCTLPPGRVQAIQPSPHKPEILLTTNRLELYLLDIKKNLLKLLDCSTYQEIQEPVFSPDGRWIAYSKAISTELSAIFLMRLQDGKPFQVTDPVRYDHSPSFDPERTVALFSLFKSI